MSINTQLITLKDNQMRFELKSLINKIDTTIEKTSFTNEKKMIKFKENAALLIK